MMCIFMHRSFFYGILFLLLCCINTGIRRKPFRPRINTVSNFGGQLQEIEMKTLAQENLPG